MIRWRVLSFSKGPVREDAASRGFLLDCSKKLAIGGVATSYGLLVKFAIGHTLLGVKDP